MMRKKKKKRKKMRNKKEDEDVVEDMLHTSSPIANIVKGHIEASKVHS